MLSFSTINSEHSDLTCGRIFYREDGEILEEVVQRSARCPITRNKTEGQKADLGEDVPAQCRKVGLDGF